MPRTGEYRAQEQMGHRAGGQQRPRETIRRSEKRLRLGNAALKHLTLNCT